MKKNIHNVERILRIIVGLVLLLLILWGPESSWFLLGLIPLLTGLLGWCPPYAMLGINTCNLKIKK
jgi:hypothetical protein